jgi:GH24 family phage-related lysozyme (muramidase)
MLNFVLNDKIVEVINNLKLDLNHNQVLALHSLISEIGLYNFGQSTLRKVIVNPESSLNRIRGAWLALKRIDRMVSKEALNRRFEEIALWQKPVK